MRRITGSRWFWLMIAPGVLVSLILCAYSMGFVTVCCDEFSKTVIAAKGLKDPSAWFAGVWLPLHLGLIAVTSVVTGDLMLASRVISIGFGLLLVVSLWAIGRQSGGNLGGGLAAMLCATHPLVVLLSATAMVDICYVSTLVCGIMFYLRFSQSPRSRPIDLFAACGMLTIACAFHYNAWLAVLVFVPFVFRDLCRATVPRLFVLCSLFLLASVPCAWVAWNWVRFGSPLAFFTKHSDYSALYWVHYHGYHATFTAAAVALFQSCYTYSPLLAILAFSGTGMLFKEKAGERRQVLVWTVLVGFLTALVYLYATGGRPAAFEPRYVLLPSMLMILIVSESVSRLWRAGDSGVRAFGLLLSIVAIVVNLCLFNDAVGGLKKAIHTEFSIEARHVAKYMHQLKSKHAPRMVVEVKPWNFLAMQVYLNRVDAIVIDRTLIDDPVRHFDNPSMLLGAREPVLNRLRTEGVKYIAAWTPAVQDHIKTWGLRRLAKIDSYTIYRIPNDPGISALATQDPHSAIEGSARR